MSTATEAARQTPDLLLPPGARLVHIGPPKTGTTTLQAAFFAAREAADAQGVHYAGQRRHSFVAIQAALGRPSFRHNGAPPPDRVWQRLLREVRSAGEARAVISSEHLAAAESEAIQRIVDDLDAARVHVVMTLRPLARILPSQWQQYVRRGLPTPYEAWLREVLDADRSVPSGFWRPQRHDRNLERWARVVGSERVTVVVIDERDHGFVLRVFERLLGLREGTLVAVPDLANRSLTYPEAEAMRALNIAFRARGIGWAQQATIGHAGAAHELRLRQPGSDEPRIETPQWALDRAGEIAREMIAGIAASGVRVVGDLDGLAAVPTSRLAGPERPVSCVPPEVAAAMVTGVLGAIGMIPRSPADDRPPVSLSTLDFTGIPTRRLAGIVLHRARRSVFRRLPRRARRDPSPGPGQER